MKNNSAAKYSCQIKLFTEVTGDSQKWDSMGVTKASTHSLFIILPMDFTKLIFKTHSSKLCNMIKIRCTCVTIEKRGTECKICLINAFLVERKLLKTL